MQNELNLIKLEMREQAGLARRQAESLCQRHLQGLHGLTCWDSVTSWVQDLNKMGAA